MAKVLKIIAPMNGQLIKLEKVKDEAFSQKLLGDGFAITPSDDIGEVVSPFKGRMDVVFSTKHAYGIKHKSGVEVLIHIGLDSVDLKGDGFETFVEKDQKVKAGTLLVKVNFKNIKSKIPAIDTPIVFTPDSFGDRELTILKYGTVTIGEVIAEVKL